MELKKKPCMTATTVICSRIKRQVLSAKKILTSVSAHSDNNYRRLLVNTEAANIRMGKKNNFERRVIRNREKPLTGFRAKY